MRYNGLPFWFMILALTGCGGAENLALQLQGRNSELMYLHDSKAVTDKGAQTIRVASFDVEEKLPPVTTVEQESSFVLPLLVVNMWEYGYKSQLGVAQIGNDYKAFMREQLVDELKRSSKFQYVEEPADLNINVHLTNMVMNAPIKQKTNVIFLLLAVGWNSFTVAGPVDVILTAETRCQRDGKESSPVQVQGRGRAGVLQGKKLQIGDYTPAMVEAFSLAIKSLNDTIVKTVNSPDYCRSASLEEKQQEAGGAVLTSTTPRSDAISGKPLTTEGK
jgi:hypothetical protein